MSAPRTPQGRQNVHPRVRARRAAELRRRGRRRLRLLVAGLAFALVATAAAVVLHSPLTGARVVRIVGSHPHTSNAAILRAARLGPSVPLADVDPGATARRVEALPWVARATVERSWPDGVTIRVSERRPVGQLAIGGGRFELVDGSGRALEVVGAQVAGLPAVAVSTAAGPLPAPPVGTRAAPAAEPALRVAATLPRAFAAQVSGVLGAADGTVKLALGSGLTVLLGNATSLTQKYEDVAAILAGANLKTASVIDVTTPAAPTVS